MKYLLILFLIPIAFSQTNQGEIISAKKFDNSTFLVGSIQQSLLNTTQFQNLVGDCWVKMEGQDISGSDYSTITGKTSLPDATGRFARNIGGLAPNLGEVQEDEFKAHHHGNSRDSSAWSSAGGSITNTTTRGYNLSEAIKGGDETRPKNFGVNMFVKINKECN